MANKVYYAPETAIVFQESGGDVTFTLDETITAGDGQVSNQYDRSTGSKPRLYLWEATIRWAAAPTLGDVCRIYLNSYQKSSSASDLTSDGAVTPETKFDNFKLIGQVVASVATDQAFYASGIVAITGRYINLGVWNAGAQTLDDTANTCTITLTPVPDEIQ